MPRKLSFNQLARIEPRLRALYTEIAAIRDDPEKPSFCANAVWYDRYKPQVVFLVGFDAGQEQVRVPNTLGIPETREPRMLRLDEFLAMEEENVVIRHPVDARLKTSEAYDTVYQTLYALLPDCRNCFCIHFEEAVGIQ
jgi:hypothetical protein